MTQSEIYSLALAGGLSSDRARTAAAIAMAESGGNPNAHNPIPPDNSYGLWQINMLGKLGPARRQAYGLKSNDELYNPAVNVKAMLDISSQGSNWRPWSTYTNGSYRTYLARAVENKNADPSWVSKAAKVVGLANLSAVFPGLGLLSLGQAAGVDLPNPLSGVDAVGNAAQDTAHFIGKSATWVSNPRNWIRVGYVVGGGIVIGGSLFMVINSTKAGKAVTKTVIRAGKAYATRGTSEVASKATPKRRAMA
jgi:hypothetical protein